MDGGARPLNGPAELERQDAQHQANEGDGQADLGQQLEVKAGLQENTRQLTMKLPSVMMNTMTRTE